MIWVRIFVRRKLQTLSYPTHKDLNQYLSRLLQNIRLKIHVFGDFPGNVTKIRKNTKSKQFCALKPRYARGHAKICFQSKCVRRFKSCNVRRTKLQIHIMHIRIYRVQIRMVQIAVQNHNFPQNVHVPDKLYP